MNEAELLTKALPTTSEMAEINSEMYPKMAKQLPYFLAGIGVLLLIPFALGIIIYYNQNKNLSGKSFHNYNSDNDIIKRTYSPSGDIINKYCCI